MMTNGRTDVRPFVIAATPIITRIAAIIAFGPGWKGAQPGRVPKEKDGYR